MRGSRCSHSTSNANEPHTSWIKDFCRTSGIPAHYQDSSIGQASCGVSASCLKEGWARSEPVALRIQEFGRPQHSTVIVTAYYKDTSVWQLRGGMVRTCRV